MKKTKNSGGMTPGSRAVSGGAVKSGVKKMAQYKVAANPKSDAATVIKSGVNPYNTKASLMKAINEYSKMLDKVTKTPGKVNGMTRNQIMSRLNQLRSQYGKMK